MKEFIKLFEDETISTIETLVGEAPTLNLVEEQELSIISNIIPPMILVKIDIYGDFEEKAMIVLPIGISTLLSDLMMGEESNDRENITDDDLDTSKEVIKNIFGSINNFLYTQKDIPNIKFSISSIEHIEDDKISLDMFNKMFIYDFELNKVKSSFMLLLNEELENILEPKVEENNTGLKMDYKKEENYINKAINNNYKNIKNINLEVTLRIGSIEMYLKDIQKLDLGNIIELNQLANAPLEVLVENEIIALGEIVVIDGNFGVQITELISKEKE